MNYEIQKETNQEAIKWIIDDRTEKKFDKLSKEISKDKIKAIDVAEAFDDHGKDILNMIKDNFSNAKNINNYKLANTAFETDITKAKKDLEEEKIREEKKENDANKNAPETYQSKSIWSKYAKKADQLNALSSITINIDSLIKLKDTSVNITREEKITEANKSKAEETLNKNRTPETAKKFFETTDEQTFNGTFDEISKIKTEWIEKYEDPDKEKENKVTNFTELIKKYAKDETISNISLKTAAESDPVYPIWTRVITFDTIIKWEEATKDKPGIPDKTISKDILFGSQDQMQAKKAEKFDISQVNLSMKNPLTQFDGKGNYRSLEKYIITNPNEFNNNFKNIVDAIATYTNETNETTDKGEDLNGLKNWYATVLTNYMISDKSANMMDTYLTYLTPTNISYLWVDKDTQVKNFNNLVSSNKFKTIKLKDDVKQNMLDLRFAIEKTDQKSFQEKMKWWFKELLGSFWGAILDIIELFWGKWALKSFCSKFSIDYDKYFNDLETMYDDTYALNNPQKKILKDAYDDTKEKEKRSNGTDNDISDNISYSKSGITSYYTNKFSDQENFKLLDPTLVELAMKEKKIGNSNVIITEKWSNGKIEKRINENENLTDSDRKKIVNYIINGDTTDNKGKPEIRNKVKTAGEAITQTNSVYNSDLTKEVEKPSDKLKNEQSEAINSKKIKWFHSATDIGIYFGAYLMKGSKDLKYTISQTKDLPFEADHRKQTINNDDQIKAKNTVKEKTKKLFDKVDDTGKYKELDTNIFTGTEKANTDALDYKNDILIPLKKIFTETTKEWTTEVQNYDIFLEEITSNIPSPKASEKLMTSIKNMLKIENNKEYKSTIDAIKKWNTYEISVKDKDIICKIKDSKWVDTWIITLGMTDKKITAKRETAATQVAAASTETKNT